MLFQNKNMKLMIEQINSFLTYLVVTFLMKAYSGFHDLELDLAVKKVSAVQ